MKNTQYKIEGKTVTPTGWKNSTGESVEPEGRNVSDYFRGEKYLGPDEDGIEPTWMPKAKANSVQPSL